MRFFRAFLFSFYFYVLTAIFSIAALPLLAAPPGWIMIYGRWWVQMSYVGLRWIVGLSHRVEGLENLPDGPFLVAAKHQSAWDTMIYRLLIDNMAPVMKRELAYIPVWGWLVRRAGAITVDRGGGAKAIKRLVREAMAAKKAGRRIVIFPEGTRVAPGENRPFLPGIAALYTKMALPVVPVAVNSGLFWPRRKLFGQRPGTISLRFMEPISPGLDRREFIKCLEKLISDSSDELLAAAKLENAEQS